VSGPRETVLTENPLNFKRLLKSKFMSNENHKTKQFTQVIQYMKIIQEAPKKMTKRYSTPWC